MSRLLAILVLGVGVVTVLGQRPIVPVTQRSPSSIRVEQRGVPGSPGSSYSNSNRQTPYQFNPTELNITFVVSAKDLPNTDVLDNIDPYIKVYYSNKTNAEPEKFGTTEVIKDSVNAEFIKVFTFNWKKGQGQKWIFKVKDSDNIRDKTVAEGIVDVDDFVAKGEKVNVTGLKDHEGKPVSGSLFVQKTTPVSFTLYARNIPRLDPFGGKSDPYVECYWRRGPKGKDVSFYTTKVQNDVENADWNETITFDNYIKETDMWWDFKVRDSDTTGSDDIGEALVEVDPFVEKRQTKPVRLGEKGEAMLFLTPA